MCWSRWAGEDEWRRVRKGMRVVVIGVGERGGGVVLSGASGGERGWERG